jgi:hypothetical protein
LNNTISADNNSISGINETSINATKTRNKSEAEIEDEESSQNGNWFQFYNCKLNHRILVFHCQTQHGHREHTGDRADTADT